MKRLIVLFLIFVNCSVFAYGNDSYRIFPSEQFNLNKVTTNGIDVKFTDNALVCQQAVKGDLPQFAIDVTWDIEKYPILCVEAENLNQNALVRFYLKLNPQQKNNQIDQQPYLDISVGEKVQKEISFTDSYLKQDVLEKLKGMRGYPGDTVRRRYAKTNSVNGIVEQIVFTMYQNSLPRKFKITKIEAIKLKATDKPDFLNYSSEKFFPFIDCYGQFIHSDWCGKTHSDTDLQNSYKKEQTDISAHPGPDNWNQYGGWTKGLKQEATGYFYTKKIDGQWWLVDPEGCLWWSHGSVRVTPSCAVTPLDGREFYFAELPKPETDFAQFYKTYDDSLYLYYVKRNIQKTYDFSAANIYRKYGQDWRIKYAEITHRRLRSWGMNTIGNCSDVHICLMRKTPYIERVELKSPFIEGSRDAWWKFNDPFHPEFRTNLNKQLIERKERLDDPWCFGYFVDNEIAWGGLSDLAKWTLRSPSSQPAKIEFLRRLKEKYGDISKLNENWKSNYADWNVLLQSMELPSAGAESDCRDFSETIAEAYYKNIREELKKVSPQKLYMGCRFAGNHAPFLSIAAKYCDVISYNIYAKSLADFKLPDGIDKPVIIGEFHFGALDRGLFHPSLIQVKDQKERGEAYYN
ncbi:MAG: beta-galactosidase, partial [Planctomycetaceae bacterium]|nr:beta-galactosidase [Planctomycetaceae bacterium]